MGTHDAQGFFVSRVEGDENTVVLVTRLFPDNVAGRAAWEKDLATKQGKIALAEYKELRNKAGDPGRITKGGSEPNRQFPDLGKDLDLAKQRAHRWLDQLVPGPGPRAFG